MQLSTTENFSGYSEIARLLKLPEHKEDIQLELSGFSVMED